MILTSRHSDRTGERRWHVAIAAAVAGIGLIATAFVEGLGWSLVLLSVAMLGLASMFGPFWTLATSFVHGVGAAAGIALINSVGNIGGFVGPYGIGYLYDRTGGFAAGLTVIGRSCSPAEHCCSCPTVRRHLCPALAPCAGGLLP
jgi:ACS family tartrate transporter-like MFS transporter